MPVKGHPSRDWPDFTEAARREFLSLPKEVQVALVAVFPEFLKHPTRPSTSLDVVPVRNDPARWRLKIPGCRALFEVL